MSWISSTDSLTWWHRVCMCFCMLVSIITISRANYVHRRVEILLIARVFDGRFFTFALKYNWFTLQHTRIATLAITNDTKENACNREKNETSLILLHFSFNGSQLRRMQTMLCRNLLWLKHNTLNSTVLSIKRINKRLYRKSQMNVWWFMSIFTYLFQLQLERFRNRQSNALKMTRFMYLIEERNAPLGLLQFSKLMLQLTLD